MSIRTTKPALDQETELREQVERFPDLARELPDLDVDARIDVVERTAAFLAETLMPHAAAEEEVLYPRAAGLLGEPDASDDVAADRAVVRELLARLVSADPADAGALQEVLYALTATLAAHFWREEELYVKLATRGDEHGVHAVVDEVAAAPRGRRFARD
jgi:iron-sulfur cluster repair protein YtfE (RIC family)